MSRRTTPEEAARDPDSAEIKGKIDPLDPPKNLTREQRRRMITDALENLAAIGAFADIDDPVEWQREIRKDRPLPGRDP